MIRNRLSFAAILLSSLLWGQDIVVEPILFGIHRSSGGIWQGDDKGVSFAGWGVRGDLEYGRLGLDADLILMRFFGLGEIPNRFSPEQGFSWKQHARGEADEFDTDYSSMKMTYKVGGFTALLGKFSQNWGPGLHSLTVSNKPPTYPQFGFDWRLSERLNFSYFHGELFSELEDTQRSGADSSIIGTREIYYDRYIASHRLEWSPVDQLTIGLMESVIYGARGIESIYLVPIMSFWSAEHYLGDTDNVQMSADLTWRPRPGLKIYGVFLMDEWRPEDTFKETNHNWFAWQGGLDWRTILQDEDRLVMEATWTDHRINRHRFPINDFSSHGYSIGHWTGAHAQSLFASYMLHQWDTRFMVSYLYAKRGELTWDMLIDQYNIVPYERFSGGTETIQTIDIIVARPVWRKLWFEIAVSHIWWANAGFDPAEPESGNLEDVDKTSFNVGFYYNFDFPGYSVTFLQSQ
ncbi:MAG: hypothetical protein JSU77_13685 [Fidelibacterota bacterium]|nr:MAG: hypothetical protein JSU77_13685 [Candidatus Neomarinimicrobiota bacterium]